MATAKLLYRRLDALFGSLKTKRPQSKLIEGFVEDALAKSVELIACAGASPDAAALKKVVVDAANAGQLVGAFVKVAVEPHIS